MSGLGCADAASESAEFDFEKIRLFGNPADLDERTDFGEPRISQRINRRRNQTITRFKILASVAASSFAERVGHLTRCVQYLPLRRHIRRPIFAARLAFGHHRDQARQDIRRIHGRKEEREKIQRRAARESLIAASLIRIRDQRVGVPSCLQPAGRPPAGAFDNKA
jgi:hypothetical protein